MRTSYSTALGNKNQKISSSHAYLWSFFFLALHCQPRPLPTALIFRLRYSLLLAVALSAHPALALVELYVWLFATPWAPARCALATATWRKVL